MLFAVSASAQEQATREVVIYEANAVGTGTPIDVTKESSEVSLRYNFYDSSISYAYFPGDRLTKMVFTGYNPGKEMERHLTVQVSTESSGKDYTTVFDGNCTIPQGGTADACIPMLTIDFAKPVQVIECSPLNVKVTCTGEASETPVYFEIREIENSIQTRLPTILLTIQSDVAYFDCAISDQNGYPIVGATATLRNDQFRFDATSGDDGRFSMKVIDDNVYYELSVKASGFPEYKTQPFYLKDGMYPSAFADLLPYIPVPDNIVISNKLDFTANHPATIILPDAPNPDWGRYYRLDRHEGRDIIFEREYEPKAGTPYVILPNEDFVINLADYDLSQSEEPERVPFSNNEDSKNIGFYGSYKSQPIQRSLSDGQFIHIIDTTPDCANGKVRDRRVGACRAYLVLGVYSAEMSFEGPRYVYVGETDGITERQAPTTGNARCHDLQGRQLQGKPERGIYIQNGRKVVIK